MSDYDNNKRVTMNEQYEVPSHENPDYRCGHVGKVARLYGAFGSDDHLDGRILAWGEGWIILDQGPLGRVDVNESHVKTITYAGLPAPVTNKGES